MSLWKTAVMSSLIQSKSTIGANQPVMVRPVLTWVNQSIHQRHAEMADLAAPTFRFSKAPWAGAPIHPRARTLALTHSHIHTHASTAYLTENEAFPCNGNRK